ncbi:MAG: SPOR domain-containing protein [Polaribacter sp.]
MKNIILFLITGFVFISTSELSAQEEDNYIKVIAKSLPSNYLKSNATLFFTIQIGAYRNENKTLENVDNIIITKEEDKITRYRLGEFPTYEEAIEFKRIVLSVCDDAFIVAIKDGERIHIKEALKKSVTIQ